MKSLIRTSGFAAMVVAGGLACTSTAGAATSARAACKEDRVATADGCESPRAVTRRLQRIVRKASDDYGLKAVVARVDIGRRTLLRQATGRSLTTLALQFQQEGRLSFDDKLSRWFPELPRADRITIRMLAYNTSGYYDYFQGNEAFIDRFHSDVFKRWRQSELLDIALARGFVCDPGTCFSYAHTNFILLGMIIEKVTGQSTSRQMTTRILRPLGLDETRITSKATIPAPVLHAFTSERGVYEDSTTWSPSWTVGDGMIATSTIDDIAKAGRAIFSGRLLSRSSYRELVANSEIAPSTPAVHYGLGLLVANGWLIQNPALNGYSGILAYLPAAKLSVALTVTSTQPGSLIPANANEALFARMAAYLSPENRPPYEP